MIDNAPDIVYEVINFVARFLTGLYFFTLAITEITLLLLDYDSFFHSPEAFLALGFILFLWLSALALSFPVYTIMKHAKKLLTDGEKNE